MKEILASYGISQIIVNFACVVAWLIELPHYQYNEFVLIKSYGFIQLLAHICFIVAWTVALAVVLPFMKWLVTL